MKFEIIAEKVFKVNGQKSRSYRGEMHFSITGIPIHALRHSNIAINSVALRQTCLQSCCCVNTK